jgi:hypothetical protein
MHINTVQQQPLSAELELCRLACFAAHYCHREASAAPRSLLSAVALSAYTTTAQCAGSVQLTSSSLGGHTPATLGTVMMSCTRDDEPCIGLGIPPCTQKMSWSITAAKGILSNTQLQHSHTVSPSCAPNLQSQIVHSCMSYVYLHCCCVSTYRPAGWRPQTLP